MIKTPLQYWLTLASAFAFGIMAASMWDLSVEMPLVENCLFF